MKRRITIIYYGIIFILILFMLAASFGSYNTEFRTWNTSGELEETAYRSEETISADTNRFYIPYYNTGSTGNCLLFYTCHQFCRVYADDSLIYAIEPQSSLLGHTSGPRWNFVSIPFGTETVCVELTAAYETVRNVEPDFYLGNGADMYRYLLKNSMNSLIITVLITAIGIGLILFWFVMGKRSQLDKTAVYFGTFSLLMGLWSLGETDAFVLLTGNSVLASFMAFIYLMLMPVPFVLFIRESMHLDDRYFWKTACLYNLLEITACLLLLFLGIKDLKETVFLTHIAMGLAVLYMIYGWIFQIRSRQRYKKLFRDILGVIVIVISVGVDMFAYYIGARYVDAIGRFGFLAYIVIFALDMVTDSIKKIEEGKKAVYYKELASIDKLTGLYSRNAFIEDTADLKNQEDMMLVTFDLNDLKQTNDELGHTIGDKYIIDAAGMIEQVFSPFGKCYRIGGDEFCTVILKSKNCRIEQLVNDLKQKEQDYNKHSSQIIMNVACGYAGYDALLDASLEDTRTRADARMYEDKAKIKEARDTGVPFKE